MQTLINHLETISIFLNAICTFSSRQEEGEEEVSDAPVDALQAEDGCSAATGHWILGPHLIQGSGHWQDCPAAVRHHWPEEAARVQERELRSGRASTLRTRAQLRTVATRQRGPELGLRGV